MSKSYRCKRCGTEIKSMHVHDFVECSCGSIFVDGGSQYTRLGWPGGEMADWIDEEPSNNNASLNKEI